MSTKILVTGATGTIGKELVQQLKSQGISFVAAARNAVTAKTKLGTDVETVAFDFDKPETFAAATKDVNSVFLLSPPTIMNLDEQLTPFINHLSNQGIKKVTYVSALGIENIPELPFHTKVINLLKANTFQLTVLKPSFFSQNFKNYEFDNITQRGIVFAVAGEGKAASIDAKDIAAVALKTLTEDKHAGKVYELTGPELFTYADAAKLVSQATGREVVYPNPTAEQYKEALAAAGAPPFIAEYMISVYKLIKDNHVNFVTDSVEELTGNKPTSLADVLKRDFSVVVAA